MVMQKKLSVWLRFVLVVLASLFILLPVASAHTMTEEDLVFKGVGPGMTMGEVKAVLGEPDKVDAFTGDGMRIVTYVYGKYKIPEMTVLGRTGAMNEGPEADIKVSGMTIYSGSIINRNGIRVGIYYKEVVAKYGEGEKYVESDGKTSYIYEIPNTGRSMTITLGAENIVREIYVATEA
jgi:hypothetical protein